MSLFPVAPNFAEASDDELASFIDESEGVVRQIRENPDEYVTDDFTVDDLVAEMTAGVEALEGARAEAASRAAAAEAAAEPADLSAVAELATRALPETDEPAPEDDEPAPAEPAPEGEAAAETVTASADTPPADPQPQPRARVTLAPAVRAPQAQPNPDTLGRPVSLTASAPNLGYDVGEPLDSGAQIAEMMINKRRHFGDIAEGNSEKIAIAKFDWRESYGEDRTLSTSPEENLAKVEEILDPDLLKAELARRAEGSLTASGGLCAPVTPYYDLAMVSVADRPVRAALPAFTADRGGIRYASPATLASVTSAVGIRTASEDAAGGTFATKSCQVVPCPNFLETDVAIIYHCVQFGNLGARTFPERVAQWNNLVLAAHARIAESALLTAIDAASTAVTAGAIGLGASATIPSQILAAAAGQRNRHRMAPDTVLRCLLPAWVLDLFVSDVYRSQFQRFEMSQADFVALLRSNNIEPSFYLDGAAAASQVFGAQPVAGHLLPFPATIRWYLFPEGSFLYLDGGTLELGLVRDSVLNETNDFQIFGETFENVAFIGVESLAVTSTTCDSGTVSLPAAVTCPITN